METGDNLKAGSCCAVVDMSFFRDNRELIPSFWIFEAEKIILCRGGFVARTSEDLQLAFVTEIFSGLGVCESIKRAWNNMKEDSELRFILVSDFKSALHGFDATCRVATMSAKVHRVAW